MSIQWYFFLIFLFYFCFTHIYTNRIAWRCWSFYVFNVCSTASTPCTSFHVNQIWHSVVLKKGWDIWKCNENNTETQVDLQTHLDWLMILLVKNCRRDSSLRRRWESKKWTLTIWLHSWQRLVTLRSCPNNRPSASKRSAWLTSNRGSLTRPTLSRPGLRRSVS